MKVPRQAYTLEFKELAVKRVEDGQAMAAVAKEPGLVEQTLRNWVKAVVPGFRYGVPWCGGRSDGTGHRVVRSARGRMTGAVVS
jgi:hypothetical protein